MSEHFDTDPTPVADAPLVEPQLATPRSIQLDLEVDEANALHQWLLTSMHDGATALDDPLVSGTLQKLSHSLEFVNTVSAVREELEGAGFHTADKSDEQVADLARRIREANSARVH